MEHDFLEDIGEYAYQSDEEDRKIDEYFPEDEWEKEFEELEREEVI